MKKIFMGALLCMVSLGCAQQKGPSNAVMEISYNARSRGFFFQVRISEHTISVAREDGKSVVEELPAGAWDELTGMIAGMDLEKLDQWKATSQESATDRAAIADVNVMTTAETYQSVSFDHGNPPKPLEALVNKIVQLAETVE